MKLWFLRLCLLLVLSAGAAPLYAAETIWSALIYATNEKKPIPAPKQLAELSQKLESVFGYNQIQLLSEHRCPMKDESQKWLLPGKPFSLSVHSEPPSPQGYQLNLQLFQDKRLLVKTGAALNKGCPILIKGPLYANGQLIIALIVE